MRSASKEIVLIRRQAQKTYGLLQLPDSYAIGSGASTSKYRIADLVSGPDHIPAGSQVIVQELGSQEIDGDLHRVPIEFVLGYIDETGAKPLQNLVMVKPDPKEEKRGSILVPECSQPPSTQGEVLAIGPDVKEVAPGQRVLFALFSGLEVELDGVGAVTFLRENPMKSYSDELLAVIE